MLIDVFQRPSSPLDGLHLKATTTELSARPSLNVDDSDNGDDEDAAPPIDADADAADAGS